MKNDRFARKEAKRPEGRELRRCFAVGVRLEADDRLTIEAPFGLDDLFALRLAPNPRRDRAKGAGWDKAIASAKARWPEVTVID